jgi:N-methylhydantoinase A
VISERPYLLGVDVGGTFTDAFLVAEDGTAVSGKAPSTPPDFRTGILAAISQVASAVGLTSGDVLPQIDAICHGTTATLNALVTGAVAPVGFLTTSGHADAMAIMNAEGSHLGVPADERQDISRARKPTPLVPRHRIREVVERVDRDGDVVVALDEEQARVAIRELLEQGVTAIAVSLLWSFRNPAHERRLEELVHEIDPNIDVSLSSVVSPRLGEFARNSTTIMNAQLGPTLSHYLAPLEEDLRARGFTGALLVMQGSGGAITAAEAPKRAIDTVGSVLTGGIIGCSRMAAQLSHEDVLATDIGGTTCLVGFIRKGTPLFQKTYVVNRHYLNTQTVRVNAIGSGGGAIAWVDDGGNLRVGPDSAGARPGPAAFGNGGTAPTNTDANVVLGLYHPERFLAGRMRLDVNAARTSIRINIAEPLNLRVEEAAHAIFRVQSEQTADMIRKEALGSGHDPREFTVYAFGGSGPVYCHAYGKALGAKEIVVPLGAAASAFSAYGLTASDLRVVVEASDPRVAPVDPSILEAHFQGLEQEAAQRLHRQQIALSAITIAREIDVRYVRQTHEVTVPVSHGPIDSEAAHDAILTSFGELYEELNGEGSGASEAGYQFVTYRVIAVGETPLKPSLPEVELAHDSDASVALREQRDVFLTASGPRPTRVYDSRLLKHGHELAGPAIVEAETTTVVVGEGQWGRIDQLGNLIIKSVDR